MEVCELDLAVRATVGAVRELVEHDMAPEFRPIAETLVQKVSAGDCDAASRWDLRGLKHLGVFGEGGVLIGAAAVGWRPSADGDYDAEAVLAWAHARENSSVLRPLLRSAVAAAVELSSATVNDALVSVAAFESSLFVGGVDGLPTARRATTHEVLTGLGFSSAREAWLLEGPVRARLRAAEHHSSSLPPAPAGFEITSVRADDRAVELRVTDGDGGLVSECAVGLIGHRGAEVRWLWTERRWRHEAFARLLLRHALRALEAAGAETVRVQVPVEADGEHGREPALGLWTSLGFHVADELRSYRLAAPTDEAVGGVSRASAPHPS